PSAAAFLFDSHGGGRSGGSGHAFDWRRLPTGLHRPFVLAGGLDAGNVAEAIAATLPWAVDVASGIELSPGIKDGEKLRRFVAEVRKADGAELACVRWPLVLAAFRQAGDLSPPVPPALAWSCWHGWSQRHVCSPVR